MEEGPCLKTPSIEKAVEVLKRHIDDKLTSSVADAMMNSLEKED